MQAHPPTTPASDPCNSRIPAGSRRAPVARAVRARFRDGDPEAVRAVYQSYGRLVYTVAYRVLGNRGLAEEATQRTFVKAWRAADSLDENRDMGPWLATIARRVAIDVRRSEAHRVADPIESVAPADPALVSWPESVVQGPHASGRTARGPACVTKHVRGIRVEVNRRTKTWYGPYLHSCLLGHVPRDV